MRMLLGTAILIFLLFVFRLRVVDKPIGRPVAMINETEINFAEYSDFLKKAYHDKSEYSDKEKEIALDQLINQKIILFYAEQKGLLNNELKVRFQKQEDYHYKEFLINFLYKKIISQNGRITESECKKKFNENEYFSLHYIGISRLNQNPSKIKKKIIEAKDKGANFQFLIKLSDKQLQQNDGLLGFFTLNNLPQEYKKYSKNLHSDQTFSDFFETPYGNIILYRGEKPKFSHAKSFIKLALEKEKEKKIISKITEEMKNDIVVNELLIKDLMASKNKEKYLITNGSQLVSKSESNASISISELIIFLEDIYRITDINTLNEEFLLKKIFDFALQKEFYNYAIQNKIHKDKAFIIKWKSEQSKLEMNNNSEAVLWVINNELKNNLSISEAEYTKYFNAHKKEFRKSSLFKLRKLELSSEKIANNAYNKYQKGMPFVNVLQFFSKEKNIRKTLGRTPYLSESDFSNQEYREIKKLKKKQITKPINLGKSFVIYELLDKQQGAIPQITEIKPTLEKLIFQKKLTEHLQTIREELNIKTTKFLDEL